MLGGLNQQRLINALDPDDWVPGDGLALTKNEEEFYRKLRQQVSERSLKCLQNLSGKYELSTQEEWREWFRTTHPGIIGQSELLKMIMENPELRQEMWIVRRIVPVRFGYISDDCLPIYEQLLQLEETHIRYWTCFALLQYTDSNEAVDAAIDLIELTPPADLSPSSNPFSLLSDRYAVNFFWDIDAWRAWAKNRHADSENE